MVEEYGVITKAGKRKGSGGGRKPRVTNGLNKGLWTPEEDAILIKYVQENGERFWNDIWRSHGLMRCGKSCKRRWMNNLRSNLKKEEFTLEEENKILRLHAEHGNRWSLLALHFPGRTDKEIKNYWNARQKRLTEAGLPIYPSEIQKELDLRHIHLQQKEDIKNKLQISPSSSSQNKTNYDSASITPLLSIEAAKKYNDKSIATSSSNSLDENPDFSLIDPMKYPLLYASLYPPSKMLHGDSKGKATLAPPSPSVIIPSNNSPHITPIDQTPTTLFENTPFPKMDDTFFSENFELEVPPIYSSFHTIAPMSDHNIVPPNGDDNQIMDPEFFLEKNNGTLGDIVRESRALFSYNRKNQLKYDQHDRRIVHDHDTISIMHNTFNNVNVETNFAPVGVDKTPMESTSSLQSTGINELDMRVNPQACVLEDFYITGNDLRGWPEFQQQTVPIEPANVSNGTIAATRNNLNSEITPSDQIDDDWGAVALSLIETIPANTDHDWTDQ